MKKRVFISFDYDHDSDIKGSLVGQAKLDDSPFEIVDMSIKEAIDSNWKMYARKRIRSCDCVIVLCGEYTATAKGVAAELTIAQEESIPYFLLCGFFSPISVPGRLPQPEHRQRRHRQQKEWSPQEPKTGVHVLPRKNQHVLSLFFF